MSHQLLTGEREPCCIYYNIYTVTVHAYERTKDHQDCIMDQYINNLFDRMVTEYFIS